MNNDVSANALSSGSRKFKVISGGERYTTKIAAVILLRVLYFNEDMILALAGQFNQLAGQFNQLSHEPENFQVTQWDSNP